MLKYSVKPENQYPFSIREEKAFSFFYNIFKNAYITTDCVNATFCNLNNTFNAVAETVGDPPIFQAETDNLISGSNHALLKFIFEGLAVTLFTITGITGNVLSIFVLAKKRMFSKSINLLLLGLAISDTIFIFCAMFVFGILNICTYFNVDVTRSYLGCILPVSFPIGFTALTSSVYFTISVTLERYLAVAHPLKARAYCTPRNAKFCCIGICTFATICNLPRWLEYTYVTLMESSDGIMGNETSAAVGSGGQSGAMAATTTTVVRYITITTQLRRNLTYDKYYVLIGFSITVFVVPIVVLLILNILIYRNVKLANDNRKTLSKSQQSENSLAFMLIIIVSIFIFCNSISLLDSIIKTIYKARHPTLEILRNFFVIFNSSINFFIYCTYGKAFRLMFFEMCPCWKKLCSCCTCWSKDCECDVVVSKVRDHHSSLLLKARKWSKNHVVVVPEEDDDLGVAYEANKIKQQDTVEIVIQD